MKNYFLFFLCLSISILTLTSCSDDDAPMDPIGPTAAELAQVALQDGFIAAGNIDADPEFGFGTIAPSGDLGTNFSTAPNGLTSTEYKGAIAPGSTPWYSGWSFYSRLVAGNVNSDPLPIASLQYISDDGSGTGTTTWTNNMTYILDGFVYVNEGQTLTIEPGTIIQAKQGQEENASALIVARGGKIIAEGTPTQPIVFTFEGDPGNTPATTRGKWGGLIILGAASLNSSPGTSQIEGIPTTEPRGNYGGADDLDDSGILKYVSIRHGGTNIGADNEINGLTLGGVGAGTTIEYVEVIGNNDDGIEWFGGTVNAKYLISAFCSDDALDYDEGYRGLNQWVIVHQDAEEADRGGEHDGGTDPETAMPYATPIFFNVTSIGAPTSRALTFRDNAGGEYHNSIFSGYGKGVDVEFLDGQDQDAYAQFEAGNLRIENCVFHNIGNGELAKISTP